MAYFTFGRFAPFASSMAVEIARSATVNTTRRSWPSTSAAAAMIAAHTASDGIGACPFRSRAYERHNTPTAQLLTDGHAFHLAKGPLNILSQAANPPHLNHRHSHEQDPPIEEDRRSPVLRTRLLRRRMFRPPSLRASSDDARLRSGPDRLRQRQFRTFPQPERLAHGCGILGCRHVAGYCDPGMVDKDGLSHRMRDSAHNAHNHAERVRTVCRNGGNGFFSKTSWNDDNLARDYDIFASSSHSRSFVSHYEVDAGVFGKGGLRGWPQGTGGPL